MVGWGLSQADEMNGSGGHPWQSLGHSEGVSHLSLCLGPGTEGQWVITTLLLCCQWEHVQQVTRTGIKHGWDSLCTHLPLHLLKRPDGKAGTRKCIYKDTVRRATGSRAGRGSKDTPGSGCAWVLEGLANSSGLNPSPLLRVLL